MVTTIVSIYFCHIAELDKNIIHYKVEIKVYNIKDLIIGSEWLHSDIYMHFIL